MRSDSLPEKPDAGVLWCAQAAASWLDLLGKLLGFMCKVLESVSV